MSENEEKIKGGDEGGETPAKPIDQPTKPEKKKKKKKKKKQKSNVFTNILLVILIAAVGVLIYLLLTGDELSRFFNPDPIPRGVVGDGRGIVATADNVDEIADRLSNPVPDGHYVVSMNTGWEFERWDTPSQNAFVENNLDNVRTVYFDLILDETEELLYSSPFLPVGAELPEGSITLNKELSAGEYPATVTYHLVDDEYQNITHVSVAVLLKILG